MFVPQISHVRLEANHSNRVVRQQTVLHMRPIRSAIGLPELPMTAEATQGMPIAPRKTALRVAVFVPLTAGFVLMHANFALQQLWPSLESCWN